MDFQNWGQEDFQFSQGWTVGRAQSGQTTAITHLSPQSHLELTNKRQVPVRPCSYSTPTRIRVNGYFICIQSSCLSVNPISTIFIKFCNLKKIKQNFVIVKINLSSSSSKHQ